MLARRRVARRAAGHALRQDTGRVLLIFQAMDAAGKDGTIKHVMSGVNPQGCQVLRSSSRRARSSTTTTSGATCNVPERGRIGIFNRSYYEEVLVVRCTGAPRAPEAASVARHARKSGTTATRTSATSSSYWPQRLRGREVLPARLEGGAEAAIPRAARPAREELEVLGVRRRRARATGRDTGCVRGGDPATPRRSSAVVRRAGRQQVVHAPGRRGRGRRRHRRG